MKLEILLGKSKSGKTRYIYDLIKEDIENGKEDILFVPSQMRAITEEQFMQILNKEGVIGVNITTISSFVMSSLNDFNLNFESSKLSKIDKKIILAKTIKENEESLKLFNKVRKKQGFLESMYIYMDIFKKEEVDVQDIKEISLNDKILENKLKEVAFIYENYNENISKDFVNNVDEIKLFIEKIVDKLDLKGKNIFFDGYNNFTKNEFLFLEALLKRGANIKIALNTDVTSYTDLEVGEGKDIFEISNNTYRKILSLCNKCNAEVEENVFLNNYSTSKEAIKYLAENIFETQNQERFKLEDEEIKIFLKKDIYDEVRYIAKDISKKIRVGARYKDFVIYTTDIKAYESVLKRIFYEYSIPYFIDTKEKIEKSKLVEYVLKILNLANTEFSFENVISILKLGLNDIADEKIAILSNYTKEFNLEKKDINKKLVYNSENFKAHSYDLEELEKTRKDILTIFEDIANIKKEKSAEKIITKIYNHLLEKNIFKNYSNYLEKIEKLGSNIFFENQVWSKLCEIFKSIHKIYQMQDISIKEFTSIFKTVLNEVYVKSIPKSLDSVQVIDVNVSKILPTDYVYFVGVNENVFPKNIKEDIFFSDFELEKLSNKNIEFKETTISKINMQRYNIYEAISNCVKVLSISFLSSDISGKALRPSNIISIILKLADVEVLGDIALNENENYEEIYSKNNIFDSLVEKIKEKEITEKEIACFEIFKEEEKYNEVLEYIKNDENLDKNTLELLYGKELVTSVSKLELFKKCPFSYFLKYSLNINKEEEYEISSLDTGTFMHDVLEKFSKYLFKNNIPYYSVINVEEEKIKEEYLTILYKIINEELDRVLKKHKENIKFAVLKQKLVNTMENVIYIIAKSFKDSDFSPFGYEIEFKDNTMFLPIEIKVNEDYKMKLIGKIDRVDVLETEDKSYVRVVDYKSSGKTLNLDDVKEGISLQLVSYLAAFLENLKKDNAKTNKKEVVPAACVYFNLSDKLINLSEYKDSEEKIKDEIIKSLRMKGLFLKDAKILEKMDKNFNDKQNRILDVSSYSLNKGSKKVLEEDEFINLSKEIKEILKDIGDEILKGVVKIRPNKKCEYCKYCDYISICRKNSKV